MTSQNRNLKPEEAKELPHIIFETNDGSRKMVVVTLEDGSKVPFYQSTGRNSHTKGVWFPFIYVSPTVLEGAIVKPDWTDVKEHQQFQAEIKKLFGVTQLHNRSELYSPFLDSKDVTQFQEGVCYMSKPQTISETIASPELWWLASGKKRIAVGIEYERFYSMLCLRASAALGGGFWDTDVGIKTKAALNKEKKLTVITTKSQADGTYGQSGIHKINHWLEKHGAKFTPKEKHDAYSSETFIEEVKAPSPSSSCSVM